MDHITHVDIEKLRAKAWDMYCLLSRYKALPLKYSTRLAETELHGDIHRLLKEIEEKVGRAS